MSDLLSRYGSEMGSESELWDFCLWPYPPQAPSEGKQASVNLLLNSLDAAGADPALWLAWQAVQQGLGPNKTVFGVKWQQGQLAWELYFYDYDRFERQVSASQVQRLLAPHAPSDWQVPEDRPYFMFSVDFPSGWHKGMALGPLNLYLGNPSAHVSSGISYLLEKNDLKLRNSYYFFNAKTDQEAILEKLCCSMHLSLKNFNPDAVLLPELCDCEVIVLANKYQADGVYFSRLKIDQMILFLRFFAYPEQILSYFVRNRSQLSHFLYDVGFDFRVEDGQLVYLKSGYYGYL